MAYDYSNLVENTRLWVRQAAAAGWIDPEMLEQEKTLQAGTPNALFTEVQGRPLLAAFMGGTGVGKSSLLNRLAGKAVARTGIERPTSREVTLFHHRSVALQHLPENLPIASVKIAQHDDEAKRHIVWIDMPDFDSIDQNNRHLVLEWLPHIDVLIYVVSPERYRDEKAWRLLLAEGARHAWLFVLNQWDRGQVEQFEDFKRQLGKAGFVEPIIFKTICAEERQPDEFAELAETLTALANDHTVRQLEQRGLQARLDVLRQTLEHYRQALAKEAALMTVAPLWQQQWQRTVHLLQEGFTWPVKQLANYYAEHAVGLLTNLAAGKYPSAKADAIIWDPWAKTRFDDALDEFVLQAEQRGIPALPLKQQLAPLRDKAPKIIETQSELAVRQALANPGNALQRTLLSAARIAEILLPLAALSWVGYQVFTGFQQSNQTHSAYLGADFLIHSSLMVAISWLTPWFIAKKLKPSLKASAQRGLQKGLTLAFAMIDGEVMAAIDQAKGLHAEQQRQVGDLLSQCAALENSEKIAIESSSPLSRMLIE
ncbi:GTPase domain-containing protein [Methylomicrobium sp. Wu6]|uniref:GTPase domain-containing protein n=1 Tax=Methylomicrobium sp. Wu6 TaxID=3107928 RepID=UPI002DD6859A|nr:GTPase domain-containing protein [Methylomicrobium sp. Wu6]MEC4749060.1 GTPase domain-containing protein [Methylomicrobium sp. Wu6]